jgi:hypothetical protein
MAPTKMFNGYESIKVERLSDGICRFNADARKLEQVA